MRYMPSGNSSSGSNGSGRIDYRDPSLNGPYYPGTTRQEFRDDPNWRYQHTPGSDRGAHTGFKPPTPSQGGPVGTPESDAAWEEMRQRTEREAFASRGMPFANMQEWKDSDPQQVALRDAFKNATDPRAKAQALKAWNSYDTQRQMQFKNDNARNAFIAQGGRGETYDNRFDPNNNWPVPRSPSGNYQYGPGRPGPTPPGVAQSAPPGATQGGVRRGATPQNAPMSEGVPPSANPMMQGYGQGVVSGGQGGQFGQYGGGQMDMSNFARDEQMALQNARARQGGTDWWSQAQGGGYNPGQSKSGMGQSPYGGGPQMSTGGDMGMDAYNPNYMAPGMNNRMEYGNSSMQGGNMMGYGQNPYMPQGGGMQAGYAPFDQGQFSMPYDQYSGMGYW